MKSRFFSTAEVSALLGIPMDRLSTWRKRGHISPSVPVTRAGGKKTNLYSQAYMVRIAAFAFLAEWLPLAFASRIAHREELLTAGTLFIEKHGDGYIPSFRKNVYSNIIQQSHKPLLLLNIYELKKNIMHHCKKK